MADTGKQSPLGVNWESSILQDIGFRINPVAAAHMGASKINGRGGRMTANLGGDGYSFGFLVSQTCLRLLTWAINDGYWRGVRRSGLSKTLSNTTYDNIISIGEKPEYLIPGLGNSKPSTYVKQDPSNMWCGPNGEIGNKVGGVGQATNGYAIAPGGGVTSLTGTDQEQNARWIPYDTSNPNHSITQWGYVRLHALQAWNEFNWNAADPNNPYVCNNFGGGVQRDHPQYKEFCSSFMQADGFITYSNQAIFAIKDSRDYQQGTFSNMPDLMTADIAGVNRSYRSFGADLMALGKSINLQDLENFGKPSNLLKVIYANNAVTQELTLALLSAGLAQSEVDNIGFGIQPVVTAAQEKQIYGAFLIIIDDNLKQVLIPLNVSTVNLVSLADLLDVQKMFPNSFASLTVPIYNDQPGPTNSKTYYPIFSGSQVNGALSSTTIATKIGNLTPPGTPLTTDITSQTSTTEVNIQAEPIGFGSNLVNILPNSLAISAGAFGYSMLQVRNITKADFQKFAQVVFSMEDNFGLGLTNGTDVPVNTNLATSGLNLTALGSGPYGSYTMSDFFGCMSGLPYPWADTLSAINQTETRKLYNIYNQLFLGVTWEKAYCTIVTNPYSVNIQEWRPPEYDTNPLSPTFGQQTFPGQPRIDNCWYTVTITPQGLGPDGACGGGYYRGKAPTPLVRLYPNNCGASVTCIMGTNDLNAASVNCGTFGRIIFAINNGGPYMYKTVKNYVDNSFNLGAHPPPVEYIQVEAPPTATLPVLANGDISSGGKNMPGDIYDSLGGVQIITVGWPSPMNEVSQAYITQANTEIKRIFDTNVAGRNWLNANWHQLGRQLTKEQRARFIGIPPVPIPRDPWLNQYPTTLYVFTDSMPNYSQNTLPHMHAQTLEAIADLGTTGGQSAVAQMRQERNQTRLQEVGIPLDNNLSPNLEGISKANNQALILNGTFAGALPDSGIININTSNAWTPPAWVTNYDAAGNLIVPRSPFNYDFNTGVVVGTGNYVAGSTLTILTTTTNTAVVGSNVVRGPFVNPTDQLSTYNLSSNIRSTANSTLRTSNGNINLNLITGNKVAVDSNNLSNVANVLSNALLSNTRPNLVIDNVIDFGVLTNPNTIGQPNRVIGGTFISTTPTYPGSFANTSPVLPTNLDATFMSASILPSAADVDEAIAIVIECNCDCWVT